ncbi:molybdenum cofactor biosynthesis protein MoaE [Inmirania thermothiophila]|uniref:Molybdopterin synthase catalytic subunit n=1 Tax=Inmirania thermothiophila TaxID=1750597 RepID=A0A3N1Y4Y1_9GAMM|nr:molybdenum cofactor biosynthesis protein MoaE [Inmirania thermothiophila]ROR32337.1 molybdopterin synthase subunit MoaE [Inmirania thermothiophila]
MHVAVTAEPIEPYRLLAEHEARRAGRRAACGATAVFIGTMRDHNEGDPVQAMTLEHYPGMTERYLERLVAEARARWAIDDALVVHRVGELRPGDPIVVVGVWAAHRAHALAACRHLIEELKSRAPFWKKERLPDGERWVEHNTPGEVEEPPAGGDPARRSA